MHLSLFVLIQYLSYFHVPFSHFLGEYTSMVGGLENKIIFILDETALLHW